MEKFSKIVSKAESRYKIRMKAYKLELVENDGGAQATYNLPQDFFDFLIKNRVITRKKEWDVTARNDEINKVFILDEEYVIKLSKTILNIINYSPTKKINFIIVEGNGNKPQFRKKYFNDNKDSKEYDFYWFVKLYEENQQDTIIEYIVDTTRKTVTIDSSLQSINTYVQDEKLFSDLDVGEVNIKNTLFSKQQKIFYGAPGTGKSFKIKELIHTLTKENFSESRIFRTTIHPEYSYFDFVGSIQPVINKDENDPDRNYVTYEFVPGIFTLALKKSLSPENLNYDVFLVIEEMSRGNVAAIFGDIFQLLDRDDNFESEFSIDNKNILEYLNKCKILTENNKIYLPRNFNILGTVNTSDQNVYVMDTAFKRRFMFEYVNVEPVKINGEYINNNLVKIGHKEAKWCDFIVSLNEYIVDKLSLNEDKQIGQFFVKFTKDNGYNTEIFKNKVLYYLWNDIQKFLVASGNRYTLFDLKITSFSKLISEFESGNEIFDEELSKMI